MVSYSLPEVGFPLSNSQIGCSNSLGPPSLLLYPTEVPGLESMELASNDSSGLPQEELGRRGC